MLISEKTVPSVVHRVNRRTIPGHTWAKKCVHSFGYAMMMLNKRTRMSISFFLFLLFSRYRHANHTSLPPRASHSKEQHFGVYRNNILSDFLFKPPVRAQKKSIWKEILFSPSMFSLEEQQSQNKNNKKSLTKKLTKCTRLGLLVTQLTHHLHHQTTRRRSPPPSRMVVPRLAERSRRFPFKTRPQRTQTP